MEKTLDNVDQIVLNVLAVESRDAEVLTPETIRSISEIYMSSGRVSLPYRVLRTLDGYSNSSGAPGLNVLRRALVQEFERYQPSAKRRLQDDSETIIVKVAGLELETYIDEQATQRFRADSVIVHLIDSGIVNLDQLAFDFQNGKMSTEDFLNFYAKSGYSVGGLASLSHFSHLTFENPLWL